MYLEFTWNLLGIFWAHSKLWNSTIKWESDNSLIGLLGLSLFSDQTVIELSDSPNSSVGIKSDNSESSWSPVGIGGGVQSSVFERQCSSIWQLQPDNHSDLVEMCWASPLQSLVMALIKLLLLTTHVAVLLYLHSHVTWSRCTHTHYSTGLHNLFNYLNQSSFLVWVFESQIKSHAI